jgi:hypothetical protein
MCSWLEIRPFVSDLVDILVTNKVFPTEGRSREFADRIARFRDKAARGVEHITQEDFEDYTIAIAWFDDLACSNNKRL